MTKPTLEEWIDHNAPIPKSDGIIDDGKLREAAARAFEECADKADELCRFERGRRRSEGYQITETIRVSELADFCRRRAAEMRGEEDGKR